MINLLAELVLYCTSYEYILDTDYTDYTVAVYKNNSVIRVIRV